MITSCTVPFCHNSKYFEQAYCSEHLKEFKKNNIKKFKELLPLWSVKRCKIHGLLRPSQCETHPAYGSLICKLCRRDARKNRETTHKERHQMRKNNFHYRYGITVEQYNTMENAQNNLCAICNEPDKSKHLAVDHCHDSKKIRGLLCNSCNRGLGYFKDNPELLEQAAQYLRRQTHKT